MVVKHSICAAIVTSILIIAPSGVCSAELSKEQRRADTLLFMQDNIETLEGHVGNQDEKMRLIADKLAEHEEFIEIIKPLIKVNQGLEGNQKEAFINQLVSLLCQNLQDNCELRRRIEALERQNEENNRRIEPPVEPTPVLPAPQPEYRPAPPLPAPEPDNYPIQPVEPWNGTLDFITDRRDSFCAGATLVVRCANVPCADGDVYHGDIFRTCHGGFVLLRHTPRPRYESYAAYR